MQNSVCYTNGYLEVMEQNDSGYREIWVGDYTKRDSTVYSDRLFEWNFTKYNRCCEQVWGNHGQFFYNRTPNEIEQFLRLYYEKDNLVLTKVELCHNVSNGYPIWVFSFRY